MENQLGGGGFFFLLPILSMGKTTKILRETRMARDLKIITILKLKEAGRSFTDTMNSLLKRETCHSSGDSDDCCSDDGNRGSSGYCQSSMASSSSSINPGRKRRRGIIEKRRRDRINHSLLELKRLVPAALEKSNSAKLEKAEILQMTVEHLKMVNNNRGSSGYSDPYSHPDAHRIAVDYHLIGFRECAGEVARYLSAVEGMDIPEQARVRLITHLQMFATQKETYNRSMSSAAAAGSAGSSPYPIPSSQQQSWTSYAAAGYGYDATSNTDYKPSEGQYQAQYTGFNNAPPPTTTPSSSAYFTPIPPSTVNHAAVTSSTSTTSVTSSTQPYHPGNYVPSQGSIQSNKQPYRPWGIPEMSC